MSFFHAEGVSSEEKRAWVMAVVSTVAYAAYAVVILARARSTSLVEVQYVSALLWTVGGSILANIVLHIAVTIGAAKEAGGKDQRDREIHRFGEYVGQSFVIVGGLAALLMSMAELNHFWIANAIMLGFFLSAVFSSATKIAAYRLGFHPW